ncbi:MAG: glycoside hydrolase, partial [Candidatus Nephrothrix sp. EaCA]
TPQIVAKRLAYMTPEWKEAFQFTARLADSLGLEMAIAGSPGWSESGGPWVEPKDGMKKIVWTETAVTGGKPVSVNLPKPASTTGVFQNIPKDNRENADTPTYYKDIAVVAYKLPANEIPLSELKPKVSASGGLFTLAKLTDGDLSKSTLLPKDDKNGFAWIQFEFVSPVTIKAVTIAGGGWWSETRALEASDDGKLFKQVCFIPSGNVPQQTISIAPTAGRYFRVAFKNPPAPNTGTEIYELVLHTGSRVHWAEEKSAFATAMDFANKVSPAVEDAVLPTDVVDLTAK